MDCTWWFLFISLKVPFFFSVIVYTNENSGRVPKLVTHNWYNSPDDRNTVICLIHVIFVSEHTNVMIMHFVLSAFCWAHIL